MINTGIKYSQIPVRIARIKTIDDGTTTGKKVYVDSNGNRWVPTHFTKETCGTADTIGMMVAGMIYV